MKRLIQNIYLIFHRWFERIDLRTMRGMNVVAYIEGFFLIIFALLVVMPARLVYWLLRYPDSELSKYPTPLVKAAWAEVRKKRDDSGQFIQFSKQPVELMVVMENQRTWKCVGNCRRTGIPDKELLHSDPQKHTCGYCRGNTVHESGPVYQMPTTNEPVKG